MTAEAPGIQYGALPWRRGSGGLEMLLVSSRETRRWIIPKGWPMAGLEPAAAAAREAFEEAGVEGRVAANSLGHYHYPKRLKDGSVRHCRVEVFALEVVGQHADWPERAERTRRWLPPEQAAAAVAEPELAQLMRDFAAEA